MQAVERIDEQGGYVAIDFRGCSSQELSEMYQAFALLCIREKVRWGLALVAGSDAIVQVGQTMQKELSPLGCDARIFRAEGRANDWLRARKPQQQLPVAEAA